MFYFDLYYELFIFALLLIVLPIFDNSLFYAQLWVFFFKILISIRDWILRISSSKRLGNNSTASHLGSTLMALWVLPLPHHLTIDDYLYVILIKIDVRFKKNILWDVVLMKIQKNFLGSYFDGFEWDFKILVWEFWVSYYNHFVLFQNCQREISLVH